MRKCLPLAEAGFLQSSLGLRGLRGGLAFLGDESCCCGLAQSKLQAQHSQRGVCVCVCVGLGVAVRG